MIRCDTHCRLYQRGSGVCGAAARGLRKDVATDYHPIAHMEHRCLWYAPKEGDPDRRTGEERWPFLLPKGDKKAPRGRAHEHLRNAGA